MRIVGEVEQRPPAPVEVAAYYVVCESLTNVAKYARAANVTVRVAREGGELVVEVADDGIGGADAARGSGLRGLRGARRGARRAAARLQPTRRRDPRPRRPPVRTMSR